jgi:hypothetical protein
MSQSTVRSDSPSPCCNALCNLRRLRLTTSVGLSEGIAILLVLFRLELGSVCEIFSIVFLRVTFLGSVCDSFSILHIISGNTEKRA